MVKSRVPALQDRVRDTILSERRSFTTGADCGCLERFLKCTTKKLSGLFQSMTVTRIRKPVRLSIHHELSPVRQNRRRGANRYLTTSQFKTTVESRDIISSFQDSTSSPKGLRLTVLFQKPSSNRIRYISIRQVFETLKTNVQTKILYL